MLWIASGAPCAGFERPDSFLLPVLSQAKPGDSTKQSGSNQELAKPPIDVFQGDPDVPCDLRNDELKVLRPKFERVLKQLADSSVAIYPVDARGIVVGFPGADKLVDPAAQKNETGDLGGNLASADYWARLSLQHFAEATGASPCFHNNDFSNCMHDAVADSENYYMLGYYRDKSKDKPGWRKLKVKVNRPDVQVMARNGYLYSNEPVDTKEARQRDVAFALASPVEFPGLPFSVSVTEVPQPDSPLRTLQLRFFCRLLHSRIFLPPTIT
jgi:hypothetical protein